MTKQEIFPGLPKVHQVPLELKKVLTSDSKALAQWNDLTELARNEWICWITFPKQEKTRIEHVKRTRSELKQGKRRPCCWIGCIHRKDKEISKSVKWALSKRSNKN